jgi:hypothetical protein
MMEPEVFFDTFLEVESAEGTVWLPFEIHGLNALPQRETEDDTHAEWERIVEELDEFLPTNPIPESLRISESWGARLTMPGYLDSTDFCAGFETEREAYEYLWELYESPEAQEWLEDTALEEAGIVLASSEPDAQVPASTDTPDWAVWYGGETPETAEAAVEYDNGTVRQYQHAEGYIDRYDKETPFIVQEIEPDLPVGVESVRAVVSFALAQLAERGSDSGDSWVSELPR